MKGLEKATELQNRRFRERREDRIGEKKKQREKKTILFLL